MIQRIGKDVNPIFNKRKHFTRCTMQLTYLENIYIIMALNLLSLEMNGRYGLHIMVIRHSVKDQVYSIIKERILRGDYPTACF